MPEIQVVHVRGDANECQPCVCHRSTVTSEKRRLFTEGSDNLIVREGRFPSGLQCRQKVADGLGVAGPANVDFQRFDHDDPFDRWVRPGEGEAEFVVSLEGGHKERSIS